jgi:serine/threonine-protein kinase
LEERFLLKKRVGKGNFGSVYRAEELFPDGTPIREVALKLYAPEATAEGDYSDMLRDCALPAKIFASDIPDDVKRHFVPVHSWGHIETPIGKCLYVCMDLLRKGVTLDKKMERNAETGFTPDAAVVLDYMRQFYAGLAAAHDAGVLHRDIKGANVMVEDNIIKILDFGMGAGRQHTDAALMTTLSIHSPENFNGQHTVESDIYQAGLMFYQFWTNVYPFEDKINVSVSALGQEGDDSFRHKLMQMRWKYQSGTAYANFKDNAELC